MASTEHEAPLALLKEAPGILYDLLRPQMPELPSAPRLELASTDLTQVVPAHLHADLVLLERDTEHRVRRVVAFEVQLARDAQKHFSWPMYAATLHLQHRCEVLLVVFAPETSVAEWARQPIPTFQRGSFAPWVIAGREIPWITQAEEAKQAPGLAVLSALIHGGNTTLGATISRAAWLAAELLPEEQKRIFQELVYLCARYEAREWMEFRMDQMTRDSLIISMQKRVFEEGREHGLQEGREYGRSEGETAGRVAALFAILHARGFVISEEQRALLSSCSDPAQLDRWITRAVLVASLSDLFE
jgi:hypothetical protein